MTFAWLNRGVCYATMIDAKVTQLVTSWNECTHTLSIHALVSSILPGDEGNNKVAKNIGEEDKHKDLGQKQLKHIGTIQHT